MNKLYAPWVGGVEKVVQNIAEGLKDQTDMKVLVCQPKGHTASKKINGVPVTYAGSAGICFSMPVSLPFFRLFHRMSQEADIVQFHMPFPIADLAALLYRYKGKTIVWWHCDVVRQKKLMIFYKPIMNAFLRRADRIIVATEGHINDSAYLGPYREKCTVIPFGIDVPAFEHHQSAGERLKTSLPDQKKVLFVGRLVYYKGAEILLSAFAKTTGAELFLVGSGPLEQPLRELASSLGISRKVHFLGKLSDDKLKDCLRDCDFLSFPSIANTEAFGLVQLEAMVYGKPVINTSLSTGVPYVSLDGVTGITVPPRDVGALAKALQVLTDDDALRLELGKNAYQRVRDEFGLDQMMRRVLNVYNSVLTDV